ncbi:ipis-1-like [Dermacentor variabilis]|uniref:ipis-1-like n=1 Tax=Dermacentor variabilis TaxID=34621 RepID=UPI003F5C7D68
MRRRSSTSRRRSSMTLSGCPGEWSSSSSERSYADTSCSTKEPAEPRSEVQSYLNASFSMAPEVAGAMLQFPVDLYLLMRKKGPASNVLLSPWYLACMMVTAYHGSSGATRWEIARALHTDDDGSIVARLGDHASRLLSRNYRRPRHTHLGVNVTSYFALYHDARVNLSPDFKEPLSNMGNHLHIRDFVNNPQQCHLALDGFFRAMAGNAPRSIGHFRSESVLGGSDDEVPTMCLTGSFRFAEFADGDGFDVSVVEIPYQDPRRSIAIFVPAKSSSLVAVEEALTAAKILTCLSRLRRRGMVEVTIPRLDVKCLTDLKRTLPLLGVVEAFGNSADFSNMAPVVGLKLSAARHLAVFHAGHRGPNTVDAQVTAKEVTRSTTSGSVAKLTVDRPFLFVVLVRDPDTVLLLGSVTHVVGTCFMNTEITDIEEWCTEIVNKVEKATKKVETDERVHWVDSRLAHLIAAKQSIL